jgi:hypothetical protein
LHEYKALPSAWDEIWEDDDRRDPKRTRVTIRLDADVVKFFKGLGEGYQTRINRVLRAYMHFRLAKLIEGPDTMDYVLRPEKVLEEAGVSPKWGDAAARMDRLVGETGPPPRKPKTTSSDDALDGQKGR